MKRDVQDKTGGESKRIIETRSTIDSASQSNDKNLETAGWRNGDRKRKAKRRENVIVA
jgi:hypothetical protein